MYLANKSKDMKDALSANNLFAFSLEVNYNIIIVAVVVISIVVVMI